MNPTNLENNDTVILELDRPRELRLTHKVMKRFCAATGTRLSDIETTVDDYDNMTRLIFEMLRAEDPALTQEQCDDLLDTIPVGTILKKGAEAVSASFGRNDDRDAGGEKAGNPPEK